MEPHEEVVQSEQLVRCLRLDQLLPVDEHRSCPYCYGRDAAVESGDRAQFCDYEPGKDPVHFGFPEESTRQRE